MLRPFVFSTAVLAALAPAALVAAAGNPTPDQWASIVDLASRQPMLTQKASKEFMLVASDVDADAARQRLAESVEDFSYALNALRTGDQPTDIPASADPKTRAALDQIAAQWAQVQPTLVAAAQGSTPTPQDIARVASTGEALFLATEKTAKQFVRAADPSTAAADAEPVLAWRQATLAQRMAKEFTLVHLGQDAAAQQASLRDNIQRFDLFMNALQHGDASLRCQPAGDERAAARLSQLNANWIQYRATLTRALDSTPSSEDVRTMSAQSERMFTSTLAAVAQLTANALQNSAMASVPTGQE